MSAVSFDARVLAEGATKAVAGTTAAAAVTNAGEADPSMTVSPDDLSKLAAMIQLEALVEQCNELDADLRSLYHKRSLLEYRIGEVARESGIKLPFHCAAGSVHKGYAADRTRNPKHYKLRARRTFIGPKKRIAVEAA